MYLGDAVAIVGGGPVGLVSALLLAKAGYSVHVFEGQADPTSTTAPRGRSIALTLTQRGWTALRRAGVEELVRGISIPLSGRRIHDDTGAQRYQPYGTGGEAIDCVSRPMLAETLVAHVKQTPGIEVHFSWRCMEATPEDGALVFQTPDGASRRVQASRILAADGASSPVRRSLLRRNDFDLTQKYSKLFYKELNLPLLDGGRWPLDPDALHLWPRGDCMLAAFPSAGRGFMCTLFMPMDGERSFNALARPRDVEAFFRREFGDLEPFLPQLLADYYARGPSHLVAVQCYPWVFRGLALIGDAAHAMVPFLGQGLNAGLEDATVLMDCLADGRLAWDEALATYQTLRKPNCDAVTEIAEQHYAELAQAARDPRFVLKKRLEVRLGQLFPEQLTSPYHIVSFSDRPYVEARRTAVLQRQVIDGILTRPGLDQGAEADRFDYELKSLARAVLESAGDGA